MKNWFDNNKYSNITNYLKDKRFDVEATETMEYCSVHKTLNITTIFENNLITINYETKDSLLTYMIIKLRIFDPFFQANNIIINQKSYSICNNLLLVNNDWINDENIDNSTVIFDEIIKTNTIIINPKTLADFKYAQCLLVYIINSNHNSAYFFKIEYERWQNKQ